MQDYLSNIPLITQSFLSFALIALLWNCQRLLGKALERQQNITPPASPVVVPAASVPANPAPGAPPTSPGPTKAATSNPDVIDDGLVAFVKKQEGFSAKAYPDNRQWSIGYGTKANSHTEVISETEADQRLRTELADAYASVQKFIPNAPLGVKQAMTDATYNLGPKWQKQGLGSLLVQGQYDQAKGVLAQYCHEIHEDGTVETLPALVNRRNAEIAMFDHPL